MRIFDNSQNWLDLEGQPLIGRLTFYKLHTSELATIYNVEGTPMANPVYTNQVGQTVFQVFLADDEDYTVEFEKYIGNGVMVSDNDEQNWIFQYSNDNTAIKYVIDVESDALQSVNNITDLRNLNLDEVEIRDGNKYIMLLGYNEPCDKPFVCYKWDPDSVDNDNGGSVIASDNVAIGRWKLLNQFDLNGVDVRHFGVFGATTPSSINPAMSVSIATAAAYAVSIGLPVYFPSSPNNDLVYYAITNDTIVNPVFGENTRVVCGNASSAYLIVRESDNNHISCYETSNYRGIIHLRGPVVRTSWAQNVNRPIVYFEPDTKIIYDADIPSNNTNRTFQDIQIEFTTVSTTPLDITNCDLVSYRKIGNGCSFTDCILKQSYFVSGIPTATVTDCQVNIADWYNITAYFDLKRQMNQVVDCGGKEVIGRAGGDWDNDNLTIENAVFSDWEIPAGVKNLRLNKCKGDITSVAADYSLVRFEIYDTEVGGLSIACPIGDGTHRVYFGAYDNAIINLFSNTYWFRNVNISNSSLLGSVVDSPSLYMDKLAANKADVMGFNIVSEIAEVSDSDIRATGISVNNQTATSLTTSAYFENSLLDDGSRINIYPSQFNNGGVLTTYISCLFNNNRFMSESYIHLIADGNNVILLDSSFTSNNSSNGSNFVQKDEDNGTFDPDETKHEYIYEDNVGANTLQKLEARWLDRDITYVGGSNTGAAKSVYSQSDGWTYYLKTPYLHNADVTGYDYGCYLTKCQFFSMGTNNISLVLKSVISNTMTTGGVFTPIYATSRIIIIDTIEYWSNNGNTRRPKGLVHDHDFEWKVVGGNNFIINIDGGVMSINPGTAIPVSFELSRVSKA